MTRLVFSIVLMVSSVTMTLMPDRAEACKPSEWRGRVKSIVETEVVVDAVSGHIGEPRLADRIDVSQDGAVVEMTLFDPQSGKPTSKYTTYFQNGRPVRGVQTVKGKTVPSMTCSYDVQGRLVEARTGSEYSEFGFVDTYEYGQGFIRRRSVTNGAHASVITETLDANGRVVKAMEVDEATSKVLRTFEFTHSGNQEEACSISFVNPRPRRECSTVVRDAHGSEVEMRAVGYTRTISFEYDAVGNWISKRTSSTGPSGYTLVMTVRRAIEYW